MDSSDATSAILYDNSGPLQLAPETFEDFVGQQRIKTRLGIAIEAAKRRGETLGHILLIGPPGVGKGTLAKIVRKKIAARTTVLSGLTSRSLGDFAGLLTNLEEGDVLFIEGAQGLDRRVAEYLCQPMKDFKVDLIIDQGASARAVRIALPYFTLIATADERERLQPTFLSSFQIVEEFDRYSENDLAALARYLASKMDLEMEVGVPAQLVADAALTPRDVLNRLYHLRDYGHSGAGLKMVTGEIARKALDVLPKSQISRQIELQSGPHFSIDPLRRRYQVFVSSTYEDLKEERRHIMQALLETKCIPTGMELFPASNNEQWQLIQPVIDDCDYYIVVVAGKYGSQGSDGRSYTEMEFDYAVGCGKSILGFYHSDPDGLPGLKLEKSDDRRLRLRNFTDKVKKRMCKPWNTPEGLASAIKSAILHAIEHDRKPGWIRASDLPSAAAIADLKASVPSAKKNHETRPVDKAAKATIDVPVTVIYFEKDPDQPSRSVPPNRQRFSLQPTFDELFLILGPRLELRRPRRTLRMFLHEQLTERVKTKIPKTPGKELMRLSWDLDFKVFEKILDSFVAQKLVRMVRPPKGLSTIVPYREITAKGQQRLSEIRFAAGSQKTGA